jgi:hypothetical protein
MTLPTSSALKDDIDEATITSERAARESFRDAIKGTSEMILSNDVESTHLFAV